MKKLYDDYNWDTYTQIYSEQTRGMLNGINDEHEKYDFILKQSYFDGTKIVFLENLHENFIDIYQKILELKVSSVMECGCGPGHHLYNIKHLFPNIEIFGVELLESQCYHGFLDLKIPEDFYNNIVIMDFSTPNIASLIGKSYEFVFSQAVMQHLNHYKALEFIKNMSHVSSKYIMMKENPQNHNYESLFNESGILDIFKLEFIKGRMGPSIFLTKK